MSFIRRKFIHGNWYLYLVHSKRSGNHVYQVIDEYIGPEEPKELSDYELKEYNKKLKEAKARSEVL